MEGSRILELQPPLTGGEKETPTISKNNKVRTVRRSQRLEGLEGLTTNILSDSYRPSGGVDHQQMVFMQAVNTRENTQTAPEACSAWLASILTRSRVCSGLLWSALVVMLVMVVVVLSVITEL